ncbi:hypothetical protein BCR36DRAFT_584949 [Piromyces finnis]|uniref:Uncharacterized protein n=1 Tax=Piromyces finnis TaxID=1754191 RepID=A0A1Y1V417_9FUNG|nr:hypothetical protein BCR36DRAFT_584949 [Piromyces finnis]|eukprot:ORX46827.1 hypothetical protein BCR36DRAFT_584949 [Piromyces finnis]
MKISTLLEVILCNYCIGVYSNTLNKRENVHNKLTCEMQIEGEKECLYGFTNDLSDQEKIEKCKTLKVDCEFTSDNISYSFRKCNPEQRKDIENLVNKNNEFCNQVLEDFKEKITEMCINDFNEFEKACPGNFNPAEENSKTCEIYNEKDCHNKYDNISKYDEFCDYYGKFDSEDKKYLFREYMDKYENYSVFCDTENTEVEEECKSDLEYYEHCILGEPSKNTEEFKEQCNSFGDYMCQSLYKNPSIVAKECYVLGKFEELNLMKVNDLKWNYYNDNCPKEEPKEPEEPDYEPEFTDLPEDPESTETDETIEVEVTETIESNEDSSNESSSSEESS